VEIGLQKEKQIFKDHRFIGVGHKISIFFTRIVFVTAPINSILMWIAYLCIHWNVFCVGSFDRMACFLRKYFSIALTDFSMAQQTGSLCTLVCHSVKREGQN
jgi:hypothetical protein